MVVISFHELDGVYEELRKSACDRQGCSVMILVANDVDAMASAKILTHLLRQDNISYKTRPVSSMLHIKDAAMEIEDMDIRSVILINCGATANMVKMFNLDQGGDLRCIVMDSHRPIHLANLYSRYSVAVLGEEQDRLEGISSGSEYSDNDSGEDEDSDEGGEDNGEDEEADSVSEAEEAEAEFSEDGEDLNPDEDNDGDDEDNVGDGDDNSAAGSDDASGTGPSHENNDDVVERRVKRRLNGDDEQDNEENVAQIDGIDDEEGSDEDVIVGRRRSTLAAAFDPMVRRKKLLRQYYDKVSSHEAPTAVMLIPLVKKLNRPCTQDLLWQAVIGATDHFLRSNIQDDLYESICEAIKLELPDDTRRFRIGEGSDEIVVPGAEAGVVAAGLDYPFFLYRHWSLYEAMIYSDYICTKLSSHKSKGAAKLQELLARMGIPLHQCKQNYSFMSPALRAHFRKELLGPISAEFGLSDPPPLFKSFYRYNGFKNPIAATDVVLAVSALIESAGFPTSLSGVEGDGSKIDSPSGVSDVLSAEATAVSGEKDDYTGKSKTWMQAFNDGYDCLSMRPESDDLLKRGINSAINIQKVIVGQGTAMLDSDGGILNLKPYRIGYIYRASLGLSSKSADGTDHAGLETEMVFTRPLVLIRLAQFLQKIQSENGQWAGKRAKPLLLAAEKSSESYIVVGVSAKGSCKTKFRKIFEKIAKENEIKFSNNAFEASIIEIDKPGLELFLYKLMKYINAYVSS